MASLMKTRQWIVAMGLLCLILLAGAGLWLTSDTEQIASDTKRGARNPSGANQWVDQRPLRTARAMAALALGRDEQQFAQQALKVADHEVDLAFADALRNAAEQAVPVTPQTKPLFARQAETQNAVKADQDRIAAITKQMATATDRSKDSLQDQIDVAKAQLELDQDELDDANEDLARAGADPQAKIQRLMAQREPPGTQPPATAAPINYNATNLIGQFGAWTALSNKQQQLDNARKEALDKIQRLNTRHETLEKQVTQEQADREAVKQQATGFAQSGARTSGDDSKQLAQDSLVSLKRFSQDQKNLSDLDKRIQDEQELADIYVSWSGSVDVHKRTVVHGMIESALWIILIVLGVYIAGRVVEGLIPDTDAEHSRLRTLRVVVRFAAQALALLLVLFVIFGTPSQMPTILGLAGAGLTVALKDFVVAFLGWFVLMGRNGIRVGDWVEINGVAGEVVEINLLRTVLLETGNWTDTGHPTGRKVAFVNSYAIEGHFFNFSTGGQWLWDELQILVPASQNPYPILAAIQEIVTRETEADSRAAEQEWEQATSRYRVRSVSAKPAFNLRPTFEGVEVHTRYITRAHERYAKRARLYQEVVDLLHHKGESAARSQTTPAAT